jgi:hypothetical protein
MVTSMLNRSPRRRLCPRHQDVTEREENDAEHSSPRGGEDEDLVAVGPGTNDHDGEAEDLEHEDGCPLAVHDLFFDPAAARWRRNGNGDGEGQQGSDDEVSQAPGVIDERRDAPWSPREQRQADEDEEPGGHADDGLT